MSEAKDLGLKAFQRNEWSQAYELLREAIAAAPEDADVLVALGDCSWWLQLQDEAFDYRERAYRVLYAKNAREAAAEVALKLARDYSVARADGAMASGWRRRATDLLENAAESRALAQLRFMQARAESSTDPDSALRLVDAAIELGRRVGDHDTEMLAVSWKGRILIGRGQVEEGLTLQDAALAAAVGGELGPFATTLAYCWLVYSCEYIGDVERADEWSDRALRFCERNSIRTFPGICLLHRARLLRLRGAWDDAEGEAFRSADVARPTNKDVHASALMEIAELRRRRGDIDGAWEMLQRATAGRGGTPEAIRGLVIADHDGTEAGFSHLQRALRAAGPDRFARAPLIPPFVELALVMGSGAEVEEDVRELEQLAEIASTGVLRGYANGTRGRVQLARGDAEGACASLQRAVAAWSTTDVPYEAARDRLGLAEALAARGDRTGAHSEAREALRVLEELGARPEAERAQEFLARVSPTAKPTSAALMFVDVVGSTQLVEAIGDEAWRDLSAWFEATLRGIFASHRGQEIDHAGDGFFVTFESAVATVDCARQIQQRLRTHRRDHGYAPQVRIGIHAGAVLTTKGTVRGAGVHRAARICGLAQGGQILASRDVFEAAGLRADELRSVSLKGVREPVEVGEIPWSLR